MENKKIYYEREHALRGIQIQITNIKKFLRQLAGAERISWICNQLKTGLELLEHRRH